MTAALPTVTDLRARLVVRAEQQGLLDIGYDVIDSPVGPLLLAVTPAGVVRVAFDVEDHDAVLASLAATVSPRLLADPRRVSSAARQLGEYFGGVRHVIDLPVDLQLAHGFRREVLETLRGVPYGATASYAGLATLAGNPRAVRAAASACSHNPVPLVVPCHRVVRSDGAPGAYLGGADRKRFLLDLERAA